MEPVLRRGEQVRVRRVDPRRLRPGDVFLFETTTGALELHRLVLALPGGWLAHRGDNQIIARVGYTHRRLVIGRADLPRRRPRPRDVVRAVAGAFARALRRKESP